MTTFIVLRVDDDDQADDLLRDMAEYPGDDLLSPCLEHTIRAVPVVAIRDGQAYAPAGGPAEHSHGPWQCHECWGLPQDSSESIVSGWEAFVAGLRHALRGEPLPEIDYIPERAAQAARCPADGVRRPGGGE